MAEKKKPQRQIRRIFEPTGRDPACERCELCVEMRHNRCVWGRGPERSDIMLVGIMPGVEEDREGKPWVGLAGEYLKETLGNIGIDFDSLYCTNVLKCTTQRDREAGGYLKASRKQLNECAPYLLCEIGTVQPKVILAMGDAPTFFFTGQTSVGSARGGEIEFPDARLTVVPTYNPAYFVRNKPLAIASGQEARFLRDVKKARDIARGTWKPTQIEVTFADTPAKVKEMFDGMATATEIVVDIETTGLENFREWSRVYCVGVCFEDGHAWALPWDHPDHPKANEAIRKRFLELLYGKTVIGHNVKFDLGWLARLYGLDIWKVDFWDTRVASHLLDDNYPKGHPLNVLTRDIVNAPNYAFGMKWNEERRSFTIGRKPIEWDVLLTYCGRDAGYNWLLKKKLASALAERPNLEAMAKTILFPACRAFCQMELNGIGVDEVRLVESQKTIKERIAVLQEELQAEGLDTANMSKKAVVIDWVYQVRGHPIEEKTYRKKEPSIARAALLRFVEADPPIGKLLESLELMKLVGTYLGDPDHPDEKKQSTGGLPLIHNGRMYPRYDQAGTVTGRTSCESPNIQQTANDTRVRSLVVAPPGWSLLSVDYSQIEMRIAAVIAKDTTLIAGYNAGVDVHADAAAHVLGKPVGEVIPDERKHAKAMNAPIQSLASHFTLWAMGRLYDSGVIRGLGFEPPSERGILRPDQIRQVAFIHDAMLFEVRDDCVEKYAAIIKAVMGSLPLENAGVGCFPVPIVAEVSVYKVWGEEMEKPDESFAFVIEDTDDQGAADESSDRQDSRGRKSSDPSGQSWVEDTVARLAEEHGWNRTEQVVARVLWLFDLWRDEDETSGIHDEWKSEARVVKQLQMWGIQELEALGALHIAVTHKWLQMRKYLAGREVKRQYGIWPRGKGDLEVWLRIEAGGRLGKVRLLVENACQIALAERRDSRWRQTTTTREQGTVASSSFR